MIKSTSTYIYIASSYVNISYNFCMIGYNKPIKIKTINNIVMQSIICSLLVLFLKMHDTRYYKEGDVYLFSLHVIVHVIGP